MKPSIDSLLSNIQLAIMGIVMVAGLFYLYRMICRIDKKVDDFIMQQSQCTMSCPVVEKLAMPPSKQVQSSLQVDEEDDEVFMQEVFGSMPQPIIITATTTTSVPSSQPSAKAAPAPSIEIEEDVKDNVSEADTNVTTSILTKTKVKKMSLDALKDVCKEKGLSVDGTKTALVDRILATLED